jgi:hypothetical protein
MSHLRITALMIASLLGLTSSVIAQNLEDVIYKKDGSVLRGVLVEQDFENGRYKIQLQGGSLFSIEKSDIQKITKEASVNANQKGIINHAAAISQDTSTEKSPSYSPINSPVKNKVFDSVFYIGSMAKSWMIDDGGTFGATYTGLNLAYQRNFSKHLAVYTALNTGSLSSITEYDVEYEVPSGYPDVKFRSYELNGLLSTNHYEGWQFYTGLGIFKERYSVYSDNSSYAGTNFILGLGYSWESLQMQLRVAINNSSDYDDDEVNSLANFQLGFNF